MSYPKYLYPIVIDLTALPPWAVASIIEGLNEELSSAKESTKDAPELRDVYYRLKDHKKSVMKDLKYYMKVGG